MLVPSTQHNNFPFHNLWICELQVKPARYVVHSITVQRKLHASILSRTVPLWMFHQFAHNSRWRQNMHLALQAVLVSCQCSSTQNRSDSQWKTLRQTHSWWTTPTASTTEQVSLHSIGLDVVRVAGQWTAMVDSVVYTQMHVRWAARATTHNVKVTKQCSYVLQMFSPSPILQYTVLYSHTWKKTAAGFSTQCCAGEKYAMAMCLYICLSQFTLSSK